mgnify:FL=1
MDEFFMPMSFPGIHTKLQEERALQITRQLRDSHSYHASHVLWW